MLQHTLKGLASRKARAAWSWQALLCENGRGFAKSAKAKAKAEEGKQSSSSSELSGAKAKAEEGKQSSHSPVAAAAELSGAPDDRLIACVALERLPLIVPPPAPEVVAFQTFSSEWNDQFRRHYPKEFIDILSSSNEREVNSAELTFEPAPRITEADKTNDRKSLQRALDRRLFLIVQGCPLGYSKERLIWHFPEKLYKNEETMRLCAESVVVPTAAKEDDVYFVGNAPCGHFIESHPDPKTKNNVAYKRFFFRSQLLGRVRYKAWNYKDYAWVTKEELLEYFETDLSAYMKQMLVDDLRVIY